MPTINVDISLEDQFLMDVLITAVESGGYALHYWLDNASLVVHRTDDLDVTRIDFRCRDYDGKNTNYSIGTEQVSKAIERLLSNDADKHLLITLNDEIRGSIYEGALTNDAGCIDAIGADVIVQVAAFGEVVFG